MSMNIDVRYNVKVGLTKRNFYEDKNINQYFDWLRRKLASKRTKSLFLCNAME
mgnify:CR=1 FL=1